MIITKHDLGDKIEWRNKEGLLHRLDGPAIEWPNGVKEWYCNGVRHRLDGPALWLSNDSWQWWQDGKAHRVDGPAFRSSDNKYQWWFKGVCYYGYCGYYDCFAWEGRWFYSLESWFKVIPDELKINYLFYGVVFPGD